MTRWRPIPMDRTVTSHDVWVCTNDPTATMHYGPGRYPLVHSCGVWHRSKAAAERHAVKLTKSSLTHT